MIDVGVADEEVEADSGTASPNTSSVAEITSTPLMNPLMSWPEIVASTTSPSRTPYCGPTSFRSDVKSPIYRSTARSRHRHCPS